MAKLCDVTIRILMVGDSGVGKTCLLYRYSENRFSHHQEYTTIGIDFKMRDMMTFGKRVRLQVWDTAGQERYRNLTKQYFRRAEGVFIIYDITNVCSFQNVRHWGETIAQNVDDGTQMMLLGNKMDAAGRRTVPTDVAVKLANELKIPFCEVSAKEARNVDEAFGILVKNILESNESIRKEMKVSRTGSDASDYVPLYVRQNATDASSPSSTVSSSSSFSCCRPS